MEQNKKTKRGFTAVDVWRPAFGPVSVKAISFLYKEHTNLSEGECRSISLRDKVDFLRALEDLNYKPVSVGSRKS